MSDDGASSPAPGTGSRLLKPLLDARQHRRHAPQPQRADQCRQPEVGVEVVGHGEDVLGRLPVEAGGQDGGEPAGGGGFGRGYYLGAAPPPYPQWGYQRKHWYSVLTDTPSCCSFERIIISTF